MSTAGTHAKVSSNPIRRSMGCEPCWIGRAVALGSFAIWVLVQGILWHHPGVPGIDFWRGWVWLFSIFAVAVSLGVFVFSFFVGCATCTIRR